VIADVLLKRASSAALAVALTSVVITCSTFDATRPLRSVAAVGLVPSYSKGDDSIAGALAGLSLPINKVRIRLVRGDSSTLIDSTIALGPADAEVELELEVGISNSSETLLAGIELKSDSLVLFSGARSIVVTTGPITGKAPRDTVNVTYTGPGATAVSLVVSPKDTSIRSVDSLVFRKLAKDAQGTTLNSLLVGWSVRDPLIGTISATGTFRAANVAVRGSTYVIGILPTGVRDSARVFVTQ
jgi:hypothetical protein